MMNVSTKNSEVVDSLSYEGHEHLDPKYYVMASTILNMRNRRLLAYLERDLESTDREEKEVKI